MVWLLRRTSGHDACARDQCRQFCARAHAFRTGASGVHPLHRRSHCIVSSRAGYQVSVSAAGAARTARFEPSNLRQAQRQLHVLHQTSATATPTPSLIAQYKPLIVREFQIKASRSLHQFWARNVSPDFAPRPRWLQFTFENFPERFATGPLIPSPRFAPELATQRRFQARPIEPIGWGGALGRHIDGGSSAMPWRAPHLRRASDPLRVCAHHAQIERQVRSRGA